MELSKHQNHRNPTYLSWLRKQTCAASGAKAECAHHIRLGTNGGSSLKPSDYFCIPLLNEYHTTGLFALHVVGEDTFLRHFKLSRDELFVHYLKQYLVEELGIPFEFEQKDDESIIEYLINSIEQTRSRSDKPKKRTRTKKVESTVPKKSITESEFYQKAKEAKRIQERELRLKLKESESIQKKKTAKVATKKAPKSLKGSEFYEKAKEAKREQDKELRDKIKKKTKKKKMSVTQSEFYQKAKEQKRIRDKEMRDKLKQERKSGPKQSSTQSEFYQKAKELKRIRDKEFRQKLKEKRKAKK